MMMTMTMMMTIELVERQLTHALVNVVEGTLNLILFEFLVAQAGLVPTIDEPSTLAALGAERSQTPRLDETRGHGRSQ